MVKNQFGATKNVHNTKLNKIKIVKLLKLPKNFILNLKFCFKKMAQI